MSKTFLFGRIKLPILEQHLKYLSVFSLEKESQSSGNNSISIKKAEIQFIFASVALDLISRTCPTKIDLDKAETIFSKLE